MDVTTFYWGQAIPQGVQVSFSLAYHDWCELQGSDLWHQLEQTLEGGERMRETKTLVKIPGMEEVEELLKRNNEIIEQLYTNLREIENLTSRMEVTLLVRDESKAE